MFELIKIFFIRLLTGIVSTSNHTKCVSLSKQKSMTQSTLINSILMSIVKNYIAILFWVI